MPGANGDIAVIERQLDKMDSTATNLETLSTLATKAGRSADAQALSDQALAVRVQQFQLYRKKDQLISTSNDWKAFTAALELVNHYIEAAMADLAQIKKVLDAAAQVVDVAAKVVAAVG
ncbi:MAG: hypothetical protein P4L83_20715 [Nevskia sp.]|nr:hypothetical protein [Nevskia sp.]